MTSPANETSADNTFNLQKQLTTILDNQRIKASAQGMSLSLHLEPDVPLMLSGNSNLLVQVLSHVLDRLTGNGTQGELMLQASEICREDDSIELCFSVSSPVHDEDSLQTTLTQIADRMDSLQGESFFECIPGKGSIIQLTAAFTVPTNAPASKAPHLSILLVDDVPINLELGRIVMEKQGHRVTTATNGAEALETYLAGTFDMIFMDVQMPVMDGFQATKAIREAEQSQGRHIPIIAMTAYATIGDRTRCLESGMDSYISKPVRPAEIIEIIRQYAVSQTDEFDTPVIPQTTSSGNSELVIFDRAELLERLGGRADLIPRFTTMFQESTNSALGLLHEALNTGVCDNVHRQAHTIKGAAANIGAARVRKCAESLDECAKSGDLTTAPALLSDLEHEFRQFCDDVAKTP